MLLAMVDLFLSYCHVYHLVPTCAMVQCDHVCRDTDSGFNCSCLDGYYLDDDHRSCIGTYVGIHKLMEIILWNKKAM